MPRLQSTADLEALRAVCMRDAKKQRPCLTVCAGSGCSASGARELLQALRQSLQGAGLEQQVEVKSTGCHGFCEKGPVMIVWPEGTFYNRVAVPDAADIVASVSNGRRPRGRLPYPEPATGPRAIRE